MLAGPAYNFPILDLPLLNFKAKFDSKRCSFALKDEDREFVARAESGLRPAGETFRYATSPLQEMCTKRIVRTTLLSRSLHRWVAVHPDNSSHLNTKHPGARWLSM